MEEKQSHHSRHFRWTLAIWTDLGRHCSHTISTALKSGKLRGCGLGPQSICCIHLFHGWHHIVLHMKSTLTLILQDGGSLLFFFFGCLGSSLLRMGFLLLWQAGATLCCCAWPSHCSGFSCCGAWALGAQASVVVAHGLSCSMACGIFPDQGSNLCPLHWQVDS